MKSRDMEHKGESVRALKREWYRKNRKRILKGRKSKKYKEYQKLYHQKWVNDNRDKWNTYQREWRNKRSDQNNKTD